MHYLLIEFNWIFCVLYLQLNKAVGYFTQAWKQTSGDPSGQTWTYRGITLLYNFTTAMHGVVSHNRIVAMLLNSH